MKLHGMVTTESYVVGNLSPMMMTKAKQPKKIGARPRIGGGLRAPNNLRAWRLWRDRMSQEQLAAAVGTTKTSVSRIESGKQGFTEAAQIAFALALHIPVEVLKTRRPRKGDEAAYPWPYSKAG